MVMLYHGVVVGPVVRAQERPTPQIRVVLVAGMQHVAVEKQRVTCMGRAPGWEIEQFSFVYPFFKGGPYILSAGLNIYIGLAHELSS